MSFFRFLRYFKYWQLTPFHTFSEAIHGVKEKTRRSFKEFLEVLVNFIYKINGSDNLFCKFTNLKVGVWGIQVYPFTYSSNFWLLRTKIRNGNKLIWKQMLERGWRKERRVWNGDGHKQTNKWGKGYPYQCLVRGSSVQQYFPKKQLFVLSDRSEIASSL